MSKLREELLAKTAGVRSTAERTPDASRRAARTETAPGMAGALAVAQLRVQELEASGANSELPISEIVPNPWQPRRIFSEEKLTELAESIRESGLLQPIVVRRAESGYQIIAGERRWRAHKLLNMETIKTVVVECSDQDMSVLALVENISRDDLTDYEISVSLRASEQEFPNRTRLAEAVGLSRRGLYKYMAFGGLPDFITRDLDLNPTLLGSNAADAIVTSLKKHGDEGIKAAQDLWSDLVAGSLDQSKFAGAVGALVARRGSRATATDRKIEKFFSGSAQAGSITKDVNGFTVKIKAGILSDVQEARIRQVISELFTGDPS
ncbi:MULTISPECIES: ParB/RepB/Spo0J family partition protein [Paraburkholderia]|uniref:ParB/RepB/Spo0J family partition protein n=1 Tax=Paraburkholderia TaxID=1822464 RepID=UPI002AB60BC0|nr:MULTISPECIES: ParB/RepB/Spo0J family partition protein [Paraburkholderia]